MTEKWLTPGVQNLTLNGDFKSYFCNAWAFYHVKNIGDTDALISTVSGLDSLSSPSEDNPSEVISIPAGASISVPGRHSSVLLTSGNVQVLANNNPNCPFKPAQGGTTAVPGRFYLYDSFENPNGWTCETIENCYVRDDWMEIWNGGSAILNGNLPAGKEKITLLMSAESWATSSLNIYIYTPDSVEYYVDLSLADVLGNRDKLVSFMIPDEIMGRNNVSIRLENASGIYILRIWAE